MGSPTRSSRHSIAATRSPRRPLVALLVAAIAVLSSALAPTTAATAKNPGAYYVALGDSRAAAPTWISPAADDGCGRTPEAYPSRVAHLLGVSLDSRACINATTNHVYRDRQWTLFGPRAVQVDALSTSTKLVTLSIGGNDISWWNLVAPCFTLTWGGDAHCRTDAKLAATISARLAALAPKLHLTMKSVTAKAPNARVFVVGHGGYYGPRGCPDNANISDADAAFVLRFFDRFNAVLRTVAESHGSAFVDVAAPAAGHDACSATDQRWFQGNGYIWPTQQRHPTPTGSSAIADLIVAQVRGGH